MLAAIFSLSHTHTHTHTHGALTYTLERFISRSQWRATPHLEEEEQDGVFWVE